MDFVPGVIVAGRFRLVRIVGAGGMGEVWAADDQETGARVALKRLLPAAAKHHEVVTRFKREAFLLGRVRSDYVARVFDFIEDESFGLILVLEFIEGPSLAHILEDRTLTIEEAVDLAVDLLHALCDLHDAKIVHRDLKPGNIIMRPLPGRSRAVIVDFGISRLLATEGEEVTGITRANIALGTVEYMAPEQILSSRDVTPITDLYAVGIILFRAVKGHHAFGERRGEELARAKLIEEAPPLESGRGDEVARGLEALVARALKKRPAQRYPSAKDMLAEALELEFKVQRDADLDDTTSDSGTTAVRPSPLASQHGLSAPPAPPAPPPRSGPAPPPRPPMASVSDAAVASAPVAPRSSMPSIPDSLHSPVRGSFPSIPDSLGGMDRAVASDRGRPPPPPEPLTESIDRGGVPKGTVALAVLTAFAVGAGVGLVLAPTSAPAVRAAEPSASCAPCQSAATPTMAPEPETPATATSVAEPAVSASAKPSATASAKPALTGKLPPTAWTGSPVSTAAPGAPTGAGSSKPQGKPPASAGPGREDPGGAEPDSFIP